MLKTQGLISPTALKVTLSKSRMPTDSQKKTITSGFCTAEGQHCCSVTERAADLNGSREGRVRTHIFQAGKGRHNRFKFTTPIFRQRRKVSKHTRT